MFKPEVAILEKGRYGSIIYREGNQTVEFYWEFGGSVLAIINGAKIQDWNRKHPWALNRQEEIYNFVANEVIRQKAPTSSADIDLDSGTITLSL